jgi:hypothetical protein
MNALSPSAARSAASEPAQAGKGQVVALVLSWTVVGLPLLWGVVETLRKTFALFQ